MMSFKLWPLFGRGKIKASGGDKKLDKKANMTQRNRKKQKEKKQREERFVKERERALKKLKEVNKKQQEKKKKKEPKETMWGDDLCTDKNWPGITSNKSLHFFGHNVNGILYQHGYIKWLLTIQQMDEYQADVISLAEVNLNLHKPEVMKEIMTQLKKYDKYAVMSSSASKSSHSDSAYKPGGTLTSVQSNWAGRVLNHRQDKLGRW